ncbi:MAG: hypothetical protein U0360_01440 [Dehalococcoidia bacterium]
MRPAAGPVVIPGPAQRDRDLAAGRTRVDVGLEGGLGAHHVDLEVGHASRGSARARGLG